MSDHEVSFLQLSIVKGSGGVVIAPGEFRRLRKGPTEILVPVFLVALSLFFVVAGPFG